MAAIGLLTVFVFTMLLQGFVLKVLWAWFVVPTFGLNGLSLAAALGLSMMTSYLTHQYHKDDRSIGEQVLYSILECVIALVIGWVIHLFM